MTALEPAARWQEPLAAALPGWLPGFLPRQRWFAGKARTIREARLEDAAWLPGGDPPCALAVVGVAYADGGTERYAMLLGVPDAPGPAPALGRLGGTDGPWVVEAMLLPGSARALLQGLLAPGELGTVRGAALRYGDASAERPPRREALEAAALRPLGAEQSNTSLGVGGTHIFKLFRKLDAGENPEVEIGRFLTTRTAFRAMPGLRGSLTYAPPGGPPATLGILQDWVESRGDGWRHTLARLREIAGGSAGAEPLGRDLLALGAVTGECHAALASDAGEPAFAPEPATPADAEAWSRSLAERGERVLGLLEERLADLPDVARPLVRSLLRARPRLGRDRLRAPGVTGGSAFHKIRVHGDYHLGQTLKTADGFVLIDFEGEPARPLAERRAKHCALKDVAGMLRSFDYAIETVRAEAGDGGAAPPLREAFLAGYLSRTADRGATFVPSDRGALEAWTDFFELDKALYEVEYELNSRPAWVRIPLRGMLRILDREGAWPGAPGSA